jgi:hypothetical protein
MPARDPQLRYFREAEVDAVRARFSIQPTWRMPVYFDPSNFRMQPPAARFARCGG